MTSSKITFFGFAFSVCLLANVGIAQEHSNHPPKTPPTYKQLLEKMDVNQDNKLASSEVKGPLKDDFNKIDSNKDGFITEEEFNKAPKPPHPPKMKR